jgi:hypothetical protein
MGRLQIRQHGCAATLTQQGSLVRLLRLIGHAATPPSSVMNARRLMGLPQG